MRKIWQTALFGIGLTTIVLPGVASAPPPVAQASLSRNGQYLVVADPVYVDATAIPERIRSTTFRIFASLHTPAGQGWAPNAQTIFWSPIQTLVPAAGNDVRGSWPLISDDGHYVALVRLGSAPQGEPAVLSIYRTWPSAALVATYKAADFMTPEELNAGHQPTQPVIDGGHSWLQGGNLAFSQDSLEMVYTSHANRTVHLRLSDGRILGHGP